MDRTAFKSGPNEAARAHEWWLHHDNHEAPDTHRNIALLTAYDLIGGPKLWAIGLPLSDRGRLCMDRSVMRRFEQNGFAKWVAPEKGEPYSALTDAGCAPIAG